MSVEISLVIDRPVADVFRWYADEHVRNHPRWDPDIELEHVSEGRVTLDSQQPGRTAITISTDVPDSIDENLITSRMQRSARNIRDLIKSEL